VHKTKRKSAVNKTFVIIAYIAILIAGGSFLLLFTHQNKPQEPTVGVSFTNDIRKIVNTSQGDIIYNLTVTPTGKLSFDKLTGNAFGSFYLKNDPSKNIINYRLPCTNEYLFPVGTYLADLASSSSWKLVTFEEFTNLIRKNNIAVFHAIYEAGSDRDSADIAASDQVFTALANAKGKKINIPENFIFKASSVSFSGD